MDKALEAINLVWYNYDTNYDDVIDKEEASRFFVEVAQNHPRLTGIPDFETSFTTIDTNADGLISKNELLGWLINYIVPEETA